MGLGLLQSITSILAGGNVPPLLVHSPMEEKKNKRKESTYIMQPCRAGRCPIISHVSSYDIKTIHDKFGMPQQSFLLHPWRPLWLRVGNNVKTSEC